MCDINCIIWGAKNLTRKEVKGKRVLEVGSYDVNGTLRHIINLLEPSEYVGVDITGGPGVDMVCSAENLVKLFGEQSFDLVVSTCTLEHVRNWRESISNIKRVCRTGGTILIIVPCRWPFHQYPSDCWRYSKDDAKNIFSDCDILCLDQDSKAEKNLVYAKFRKPMKFIEKDLSGYLLYSVVVGKKVSILRDEDFKKFYFKFLVLKSRVKYFLSEVIKAVSSKI